MSGFGRLGIALGVLGLMVILIGLFPEIVGIAPTPGIGIVKITTILIGFSILIAGALTFIQSVFYPGIGHNLGQQIAIRLSLTGLLISAATGYADVLGYGSNPPGSSQRPILGPYQGIGLIGGFVIAAFGVLIFALAGLHVGTQDETPVAEVVPPKTPITPEAPETVPTAEVLEEPLVSPKESETGVPKAIASHDEVTEEDLHLTDSAF